MDKFIEIIDKYVKLFKNQISIEISSNFKIESISMFLNSMMKKIESYINYIIDNNIFFEDRNGCLFLISHELTIFDELYQKYNIKQEKKYIQIISPAIEIWIQNM